MTTFLQLVTPLAWIAVAVALPIAVGRLCIGLVGYAFGYEGEDLPDLDDEPD